MAEREEIGDAVTAREKKGRNKRRAAGEERSSAREWLKSIAVAAILFLFVRTFILQTFVIVSGSMEDTLLVGDMLVANRLSIGARIPGTQVHVPGWSKPRRGDVMVFLPHHVEGMRLVKRVIGLPGDTVQMRDGRMWVDGRQLDEPYVKDDGEPDRASPDFEWQRDHLTSDVDAASYTPTLHNWGPLVVPEGQYFMMGDHRDSSLDSRYWGFLAGWRLEARVVVIYFSYNRDSYKPFPALREIRWCRLGMTIGAATRAASAAPSP